LNFWFIIDFFEFSNLRCDERFTHAITFSKKLRWLSQTMVITKKTQTENACRNEALTILNLITCPVINYFICWKLISVGFIRHMLHWKIIIVKILAFPPLVLEYKIESFGYCYHYIMMALNNPIIVHSRI